MHLLVTPREERALAAVMQTLGRQYVRCFNTRHQRSGTLWEGRFRASLVEGARFGLVCQQYLERLPVAMGLAPTPAQLPVVQRTAPPGDLSTSLACSPSLAYWALGNTPFEREAAWQTRLAEEALAQALAEVHPHLAHRDLARLGQWAPHRHPCLAASAGADP